MGCKLKVETGSHCIMWAPGSLQEICYTRAHLLDPAHCPAGLCAHHGEGGHAGAEHVTIIFRELREVESNLYPSQHSYRSHYTYHYQLQCCTVHVCCV